MMDTLVVTILVSILTILLTVVIAIKLKAWQDRQMFWLLVRDALAARLNVLIGVAGMLVYLAIYLIGGKHLYYFYSRVIWAISFSEIVMGAITALLVGLVFALFPYSLKKLGILNSQKSGWGVFGTILAVIVSFCP